MNPLSKSLHPDFPEFDLKQVTASDYRQPLIQLFHFDAGNYPLQIRCNHACQHNDTNPVVVPERLQAF